MPAESPPPEVVTAAMRVFRYRAIAAIAIAVALVLSTVILKSKLDDDSQFLARVASSRYESGGVMTLAELKDVDGVSVMLWEVVVDDSPTSFVHVQAWDQRGRDFTIVIAHPVVDGEPTTLASIESGGGGRDMTYADLWQEIRLPRHTNEIDRLTFDVEVRGEDVGGSVPFEISI
jgi:hypothetical protein